VIPLDIEELAVPETASACTTPPEKEPVIHYGSVG
jgi:hypothetical protein